MAVSQAEADALLAVDKVPATTGAVRFPAQADQTRVGLLSVDRRVRFDLYINRRSIRLTQCSYQSHSERLTLLARLDLDKPHRNPDGTEVPGPHLHLYSEQWGEKFAVPAPISDFPNLGDFVETLRDFMRFIHVVQIPPIQLNVA